jgi:hypothetical protein
LSAFPPPFLKGFFTLTAKYQNMSQIDLERIREWADAKLSGQQKAGTEREYLKLYETVDAILTRRASAAASLVSALRPAPKRNAHLQLIWPSRFQRYSFVDRSRLIAN